MITISLFNFLRSLVIILPAITLLYWLMGRLEGRVREEDLFKSFLFGIVPGIIVGYLSLFFTGRMSTYFLNYLISIPLIEESSKGVYLLMLRLSKNVERVARLYSFGISLGASAVFIVESAPYEYGEVAGYLAYVLLYTASYVMLHATNGGVIALYSSLGKGTSGLIIALLNNLGFKAIIYSSLQALSVYGIEIAVPIVGLLYSLPGFYIITRKMLSLKK